MSDIHFVTSGGSDAYCGWAGAVLTRDVKEVTCERCRATEAWREQADMVEFAESIPESRVTEPDAIVWMRWLVESREWGKRDGVLVDVQTAHAVVAVYDALTKEEAKARFAAMPMPQMGLLAWKLVNRAG